MQEAGPEKPYFEQRGYYITFMRSPLFTLAVWKDILNGVKADGGNLVILWMAGAFPSRKFPITWRYNAEHENIKNNFAGELIDYAHSLDIQVLLGLTPFGYDGVNQYALEHPELKAINEKGNYTKADGLDAWGYSLNPYRPEAQKFMLDYTLEMLDFYPGADGLLLESSDETISYCADCTQSYYEKEFEYVRRISDELWARKPEATIAVYPHYFSGAEVPHMNVRGDRQTFDPRWSLFFTPHSAPFDAALMAKAKSTLAWTSSPTLGSIQSIADGARRAKDARATGFVPSFEPLNYIFTGPDTGAFFLIGQRVFPFGLAWLKPGQSPMQELMLRLLRLAYREYARNPDLSAIQFRELAGRELLPGCARPEIVDDLFFVEESFFVDRNWDSKAVLASPDYVKGRLELGELGPIQLADFRTRLKRLEEIAQRYRTADMACARELGRTAGWIVERWNQSPNRGILDLYLR
jgi:hypothetical protein